MDNPRWSVPKSDRFHSLQPKMAAERNFGHIEKLCTVSENKTRS